MAERFFTRLTNDVLEATEKVANRMEEGLSLIFNNDAKGAGIGGGPAAHATGSQPPYDNNDEEDLEESLRGNPLQGMAESVVGGIMGAQVRWRGDIED
jgi:hypothetical protein